MWIVVRITKYGWFPAIVGYTTETDHMIETTMAVQIYLMTLIPPREPGKLPQFQPDVKCAIHVVNFFVFLVS